MFKELNNEYFHAPMVPLMGAFFLVLINNKCYITMCYLM